MRRTALLFPLTLTAMCAGTVAAGQVPAPAEPVSDTITLGVDGSERMTVPVSIGARGPYRFIVDTGADRTVISRELAGELKLDPAGSATMHSITGVGSVDTVMIPLLGVNRDEVRDIRAPALARAHLGAAGLLGLDSLKKNRVLLDFKQQTMTITPSSVREERRDRDEIVVTARSKFGQLILTDAEANGHRASVIVDTGSQISVGNAALRKKLLGKNIKGPPKMVELVSVTGERILAEYTYVRKIKIGGVTLTDLPIAFAEIHPFRKFGLTRKPALMLGMNALRVFDRVSVDFANRKVRFLIPEGAGRDNDTMLAMLDQGRSSR